MAITPKTEGAIDAPNTLTPESAGSVAVPNTLAPESAGSVAAPNTLAAESAGSVSAPNTLTAESAGSVSVPNTLTSESAGSVAVPNTLTPASAAVLPRALTPTVDINYASGLFAQNGSPVTESSLITFARASTATFISRQVGVTGRYEYFLDTALSGVQRIEYDAATGECLGALIEQGSTNLCLRSEEFDNASWNKVSVTIEDNSTTAPDNAASADKAVASSTSSLSLRMYQDITSTATSSYTISSFVKRAESSVIQIWFEDGHVANDPRVNFDLSVGVISAQDADILDASITPVGGGWFRVTASIVAVGTLLRPILQIASTTTELRGASSAWAADEGLYIWGAQVEQAPIPTSYIPTTTTAVSRLADQASMPVAGNVPSGDMTTMVDIVAKGDSGAARNIYFSDASSLAIFAQVAAANSISIAKGGTGAQVVSGGARPDSVKLSAVFDSFENEISGYLDGALTVTQYAGAINIPDTGGVVGIGNSKVLTNQLNGHIKRFTIYDAALTATEVSEL